MARIGGGKKFQKHGINGKLLIYKHIYGYAPQNDSQRRRNFYKPPPRGGDVVDLAVPVRLSVDGLRRKKPRLHPSFPGDCRPAQGDPLRAPLAESRKIWRNRNACRYIFN